MGTSRTDERRSLRCGPAFVVVVLALVPRFGRSLKEDSPARSPWRVMAFVICFVLAFQLLDLVRR